MRDKKPTIPNLTPLEQLYPPNVLLHVGGNSKAVQSLGISARKMILVEAEGERYQRLKTHYENDRSTLAVHAAIGKNGEVRRFFSHSLEDESGLLPAQTLAALWPNIETYGEADVELVSAETLFSKPELQGVTVSSCNWLIIDCFPSGEVLEACQAIMETADVIISRVVQLDTEEETDGLFSSSRGRITSLLLDTGFIEISVHPMRNEKIGKAVFVRDWRRKAEVARAERGALKAKLTTTQADLAKLRGTHEVAVTAHEAAMKLAFDKKATDLAAWEEEKTTILQSLDSMALEKKYLSDQAAAIKVSFKNVSVERDGALGDLTKLKETYEAAVAAHEAAMKLAFDNALAHQEEAEYVVKKQRLAENNLEAMRNKYTELAKAHLVAEEKLVRLGNEARRIISLASGRHDGDEPSTSRPKQSNKKARGITAKS